LTALNIAYERYSAVFDLSHVLYHQLGLDPPCVVWVVVADQNFSCPIQIEQRRVLETSFRPMDSSRQNKRLAAGNETARCNASIFERSREIMELAIAA